MRLISTAAIAASLALASTSSFAQAQDANCSAIYNDFAPSATPSSPYQKCYTDQAYNTALVLQGVNPNYSDILAQICSRPACSHSTLVSANAQYLAACASSIDAEATNGNILQTGKIALELFFAEPIRAVYCTLDPNAHPPPAPPTPPGGAPSTPAPPPPSYCLEQPVVGSPTSKFATNMAIFLTSGTIRAAQPPFFETLDQADTCSPCSQRIVTATVSYLSENLMPRIGPFYTPEFVQYWTKFVLGYNTLCKTNVVQSWPEGTLNVTLVPVPTPVPSATGPAVTVSVTGPSSETNPPRSGSGGNALSVEQGGFVVVVTVVASLVLPWL
ncbi:hypothetical protein BGZ95_012037 [Linnemannia exigua]|uniref:Uncharacterized protein n=1 Tax=Linnemannia exigua TaxID=604196 RepID=A0AAD4D918_9FUNG|nr:hypothetical protein BGZ95_012037 [Linnemannia exigua]